MGYTCENTPPPGHVLWASMEAELINSYAFESDQASAGTAPPLPTKKK
jgi:hypothetical protein